VYRLNAITARGISQYPEGDCHLLPLHMTLYPKTPHANRPTIFLHDLVKSKHSPNNDVQNLTKKVGSLNQEEQLIGE
jgi:hypothetical protein